MNSDQSVSFDKLKEEFNQRKSTRDLFHLEKCMREFKTQLFIKRNQVIHLESELEKIRTENNDLKKEYDKIKKEAEDDRFNLMLLNKKHQVVEEELQEKRYGFSRMQLQNQLMTADIKTLKENYENAVKDNVELMRKNELLEQKHKYDSTYHTEIIEHQAQLKRCMGDFQQNFSKLQAEQSKIVEVANTVKLAKDTNQVCLFVNKQCEILKKDKEEFENEYIKIKAAYDKLIEMLDKYSVNLKEPNLLTKLIFQQWRSSLKHHSEQMDLKNGILTKLTDQFTKERMANAKLIKENEELNSKIKQLEKQIDVLNFFEVEQNDNINSDTITVKSEPVDIIELDE